MSQQIAAQLQNADPPLYAACATPPTYQTGSNAIAFTNLPSGYSAQVSAVGLWDPNNSSFDFTQAACNTYLVNSHNQSAPQLITATVTYPSGGHSTVTTVVNNPNPPTPPAAGAAAQLSFYTQPGGAQSAQNLVPQPVVEVQDSSGTPVINDLSTLTLTLTDVNGNPPSNGATLSGCAGHENSGYVTFVGCSVAKTSTYEIKATDSGLPPTYFLLSSAFTITTGPPSQILFTQQPGNSTGGTAFATGSQPQITVEDAGGNVVTGDSTSQISLAVSSGGGSGTLTCTTNPLTVTGGVASFAGCSVNTIGTYTLTATDVESTGTLTATSASFTISVGAPAQLVFTTSPGASTSGTAFAVQPVVAIEDAGGNIIPATKTGYNDNISIAVQGGAGDRGRIDRELYPQPATGDSRPGRLQQLQDHGYRPRDLPVDGDRWVADARACTERDLLRGQHDGLKAGVCDVALEFGDQRRLPDSANRVGRGLRWRPDNDRHQHGGHGNQHGDWVGDDWVGDSYLCIQECRRWYSYLQRLQDRARHGWGVHPQGFDDCRRNRNHGAE